MSENNESRDGGGGFFAGFLFGAIAGGAVAYFIMQEEARDMLVGKAREASNFAMDATGDLRGRVSEAATSLQSNAAELYARGKTVVDNARSNVDAAVEEGRATASQVRTDLGRQSEPETQIHTSDS